MWDITMNRGDEGRDDLDEYVAGREGREPGFAALVESKPRRRRAGEQGGARPAVAATGADVGPQPAPPGTA